MLVPMVLVPMVLSRALLACALVQAPAPTAIATPAADFELSVRVVREPSLHLDLRLDCAGDADGETTFSLSEDSGGVLELGSWIEKLAARDRGGHELELKHEGGARWSVKHSPKERMTLSWSIGENERQLSPDPRVHYAPVVNHDLVHLLGGLAFLMPESALFDRAAKHIALRWEGLEELGWSAVSVRGPAGSGERVEFDLSPSDFRNAPFAAGKLRLHKRTIHGEPLYVSLADGALPGDDDRFVDLAAKIVEAQRAFFDDWKYPGFLISVVPVGAPGSPGGSVGGTGLSDSFALFLNHGMRLDSPTAGMSVASLLSHEMFHHWNGQVFQMHESPQTSFWFSEGFTEFFARRIELRAHLIDEAQYIERLNRSLAQYYASDTRSANALQIRERFFTDRDYADQPYRRGDAIAMRIDQELRKRSAGTQCLDDLMRDLVLRGTRGEQVSPARFYELVAEKGGKELADHVRAVAEQGTLLELPDGLFEPCLTLERTPVPLYELGFDFEKSIEAKEVRGVREGSRAHQAGLREGMKLASLSMGERSTDRPIKIEVMDGGKRRALEWLPHGESTPGYRLTRKPNGDCAML